MMNCLTSGTGLITFGRQDSCCALSGTVLWHWLGILGQLLPVPPVSQLRRGSPSLGTRRAAHSTFKSRQLFCLWEVGKLNVDVFLKHHWPLLERGYWFFGASDLIPCCRCSASKGPSLFSQKVLHSWCHLCDVGQKHQDSAQINAAG